MKAEYDFASGKRGPVLKAPAGKTRITIRIDDDLLQWFRKQVHGARGGSYQTLHQCGTEGVRRHQARAA